MEYDIENDDAPNLKFEGELLAIASSYKPGSERWTVLELYKTEKGKFYVCVEVGKTMIEGEHQRQKAIFVSDLAEVRDYFGYGWLAKNLYRGADIEGSITVE